MKVEFVNPRFTGDRFSEHTLPVDVARDLAAYEELIVELAKHLYLVDHPGRQRVPKGFESAFNLHIEKVEEGSARPFLVWVMAAGMALQGNEASDYFQKGRDLVAKCIAASAAGEALPENFPKHLLDYFNTFGRSLREGEAIELPITNHETATLTPGRRKELVLQAQSTYQKEIELLGSVASVNWEKETFCLRTEQSLVPAPLPKAFAETIRQEGGKERTMIIVQGVGIYDAWEHLQKVSETKHVEAIPNYRFLIDAERLYELKNGWLNGAGSAPDHTELGWVLNRLTATFPTDLPLPIMAPTGEGGLFLEWISATRRTSAEILLPSHICELQTVNLQDQSSEDEEINLDHPTSWERLYSWLGRRV